MPLSAGPFIQQEAVCCGYKNIRYHCYWLVRSLGGVMEANGLYFFLSLVFNEGFKSAKAALRPKSHLIETNYKTYRSTRYTTMLTQR
ncbi:hypothetical protein ASPBRDRAFT_514599 [Aspergillus brasiliensis CBS 101740]|uniref:Uncharacterized protein n=1 Tax=Aspergillus brasiliensis (strain CBS 101740 / IMI 381727 / IBT 21946) TaxID=767769 RepID=A0A1L9UQ57_ASPBC|nr:hypothetical protein ASPBRDRAFT_514599 [Aspergillus brasiliensis CBS 101740]